MKKRLAVVHWFPLEQYPPVTNLLSYFASQDDWQTIAFSCDNDRGLTPYANPGVEIKRWSFPSRALNRFRRYVAYLGFPIFAWLHLLRRRPDVLLYIEPHSALPAFLYCMLARRCRLFIHYHEYHDPDEYLLPGMRLVRLYHWIEKRFLFRRAEWISQTNDDRVRMFRQDHSSLGEARMKVLSNYPPSSWMDGQYAADKPFGGDVLRLVYVGSLSLHDTFIEELLQWINSDRAAGCELDVFSYNHGSEIDQLFEQNQCARIRFHAGGIPYDRIPEMLRQFHVGLILYKGNTRNYIYNASNKLFEYLALDLDVWYPKEMIGVRPYARTDKAPRVVELDFSNLHTFDPRDHFVRHQLPWSPQRFSCESVLRRLESAMSHSIDADS